ncbi:glycoside hydrolase [Mycena rebaudengoi]|nr:glycoside hydrolase [Mycena rebaudengoi]
MIGVSLLIFALSLGSVLATVPVWSQCGGQNYSGDTVCETGSVCTVQNPFYFQCLPGTATTTVTPTTTRITTVSSTTTSAPSTITGFVKTSGTRFTVNGSKYTVVGSNGYWLPLTGYSKTDVDKAFADIAASGATTVRQVTFFSFLKRSGFNEVTNANGVYFQLWNGKTPTVNTGANGLGALDIAIASAKAHGLRLIVALTNNWSDFGGMDVYTAQILGSGQSHDLFYTNPTVVAAFKAYVRTVVTRYVNEPGIMAWELANEPRCKGSNTGSSATCTPATITAWASNLSAFIKSIDSNHLVGIGDEGFYNQPGSADYPYQGGEGIDFAANLKISTIDFGTVHAYPLSWGEGAAPESWGVKWITDHAASQNATNKPVILEEFGLPDSSRNTIYTTWFSTIVNSGLAGDLIWQAGSTLTNGGQTHNDGYTIYPTDPVYALLKSHSAALKARG